jgi:hypothetical protein
MVLDDEKRRKVADDSASERAANRAKAMSGFAWGRPPVTSRPTPRKDEGDAPLFMASLAQMYNSPTREEKQDQERRQRQYTTALEDQIREKKERKRLEQLEDASWFTQPPEWRAPAAQPQLERRSQAPSKVGGYYGQNTGGAHSAAAAAVDDAHLAKVFQSSDVASRWNDATPPIGESEREVDMRARGETSERSGALDGLLARIRSGDIPSQSVLIELVKLCQRLNVDSRLMRQELNEHRDLIGRLVTIQQRSPTLPEARSAALAAMRCDARG